MHCGIGSCGGQHPSVAPYVTGMGAQDGATAPERADVAHALWERGELGLDVEGLADMLRMMGETDDANYFAPTRGLPAGPFH